MPVPPYMVAKNDGLRETIDDLTEFKAKREADPALSLPVMLKHQEDNLGNIRRDFAFGKTKFGVRNVTKIEVFRYNIRNHTDGHSIEKKLRVSRNGAVLSERRVAAICHFRKPAKRKRIVTPFLCLPWSFCGSVVQNVSFVRER